MKIAIDGPAGAGKSTVAKEVSRRLGIGYLDTGAMYRALTLKALYSNTRLDDELSISNLVRNTDFEIQFGRAGENIILLDKKDVTNEIRSVAVNNNVSIVASSPVVRAKLVQIQREIAYKTKKLIMDGRDIGTVVLPEAEYKFFLDALLNERVHRRWLEFKKKGTDISKDNIKKEIMFRDKVDRGRKVAPLRIAPEAVVIDTTNLSFEQVVKKVIYIINNREQRLKL